MTDLSAYLTEIELALIRSPIIAAYQVIRSEVNTDDGYIRVRATLSNGDFLEAAEYFILVHDAILTDDYRYHWMDASKTVLRKRWDCTPDHPELPNFPHHVHIGDEQTVVPGQVLSLIDLLDILERDLA
jgi:hypothetical protein